jgi:hypothetical protein
MPAVLLGVTDPATMLDLIVGAVILGAAALRGRWNGRPF